MFHIYYPMFSIITIIIITIIFILLGKGGGKESNFCKFPPNIDSAELVASVPSADISQFSFGVCGVQMGGPGREREMSWHRS